MSFKTFLIFSSGGHFIQPSKNGLCNLSRGYYEKHFCEIILNLDQWFRRCLNKFYSHCSLFVQWSRIGIGQ